MKLELESNLTFLPSNENGMDTDQLFTCNVCQKTFLQIDDLRKHNKNHLFSCADCNQAFNDQITLTKHQEEVHTQDKSFHCSQCDKSFKELRTLRLHLKIHNSDYPEHCEVCKKGFRTKWQLKQHLMDHGGKRPYPCPECSFTCKTKQQLNEHRRKHSGEKAYSCSLCGTRFTYRNGLIKHTKLNRCPKKIFTSDGEKMIKKKAKSMEQLSRQNIDMINNLASKSKAEKSVLDQKILDVIQKRSALKTQLSIPELNDMDPNNNQALLRRAALVQSLQNNQIDPAIFSSQSPTSFAQAMTSPVSFNPSLTTPTMSTTTTFLTNSTDISSWAATLPAGTKVTVTHYDASKKPGEGQLVATPTHTETIIVTPPKSDTDISLIPLKSPKVQLPTSPLPLIQTRPGLSAAHEKLIQDSQLITTPDEPKIFANIGQPSYTESFAVDPNDILLKNKPIKQEPFTLPSYQEAANFNLSKFKLCNPPPTSPIDVQLTAQALLMNVKPDPNFDPNLKIKKEFEEVRSSLSPPSACSDGSSQAHSQSENWFPISNMNEIKKEVLDELFDNTDEAKVATENNESQHPNFLVPQLSVKSEHEDSMLESDDFYNISLKMEPISPQSNSSISDNDHDSFSFHKDLDTIVASFGKSGNKHDESATTVAKSEGMTTNPKPDFVLPDLDLDFSNFFDDNIGDINMNEQDFLQMRMDTFDACSEIMSNV